MDLKRLARHLMLSGREVARAFPRPALDAIDQAIKDSEATHRGEIRFAVEGALDDAPLFKGQSARERAIDLFSALRIWDTELNNGVLIYVLLADRDVEIVADRGIAAKVDAQAWQDICHAIEAACAQGDYAAGALKGIRAVTEVLAAHFPADGGGRNELPDEVVVL
jgi:uncharacterized membrane protein